MSPSHPFAAERQRIPISALIVTAISIAIDVVEAETLTYYIHCNGQKLRVESDG